MIDERKETIRGILEVLENNDSWFAQEEQWGRAADLIRKAYSLYREYSVEKLMEDDELFGMGGKLMRQRSIYAFGKRANDVTRRKLWKEI